MLREYPDNTPLFCKPPATIDDCETLSTFRLNATDAIHLRSLNLFHYLDCIHDWVNRDYAKRFWQFAHGKKQIHDFYSGVLENPDTHSFIGLLNRKPVCQIDLYRVKADELGHHVQDCTPEDCGIHLLMMPPERRPRGLSFACLQMFLHYYFSFSEARRMYGEPDMENLPSNYLVRKLGFEFLRPIRLSYKNANLYAITKEQFYAKNQIL